MITGENFFNLCIKLGIGKHQWDFNSNIPKAELIFSMDELHKLNELKIVFNGQNGGFVLGNSHDYGGIHLLQQDLEKI